MRRGKEGYNIVVKGTIEQEEITIMNAYPPNTGVPNLIKHTLVDVNIININTDMVRDLNIHCHM